MSCNNHFRRGDTFSWSGSAILRDQDGLPIDSTGVTAQAQLRLPDGTKVADLSVTLGGESINLRFYGDSSTWPLVRVQIDVQFTMPDGQKVGTNKDVIEIVEGVTR